MRKNKIPFFLKIAPFFLSTLFFHSGFFIFLTPFPLLLMSLHPEARFIWMLLAVLSNALIVFFISQDLLTLSFFSLILLVGVALSVFTNYFKFKPARSIFLSVLGVFLCVGGLLTVYSITQNKSPLFLLEEQIAKSSEQAIQIMKAFGQKEIPNAEELKSLVLEQGIFMFYMFFVLLSWGNILLAFRSPALKLYQRVSISKDYFRTWKLPEHLIWLLIATGAGAVFISKNLLTWFISFNLLKMVLVVYALQGLAIIAFFLNLWKIEGFLRVLVYLVIFSSLAPALVFLGVLDLWFDFRVKFGQINKSKENL